jgi:hypothetical protein
MLDLYRVCKSYFSLASVGAEIGLANWFDKSSKKELKKKINKLPDAS